MKMNILKKIYNHILCLILDSDASDRFWRLRSRALAGGLLKYGNILRYQTYLKKRNSYIPLSAAIDGKIVFPHGVSGIFISGSAKIGKGCTIFQQVTIGSNALKDSKGFGAPEIGNNVFIGAGAKIIGGVHIGDNVRIGANCTVVKDIPPNATVVPASCRIFEKKEQPDNVFTAF